MIEGVTERRITLDHVIASYSKVPIGRMKKQIRILIRMGIYQLLYMDGVADHAAVSETVKMARRIGFSNLSGFVNGILRNVCSNRTGIPWPDEKQEPVRYMSVKYSCPEWIVDMLVREQGAENARILLELSMSTRPVTARVNLSRTNTGDVIADGYCRQSEILENAVVLEGYGRITDIPSFENGSICIQDISSMLVCNIAGIKKNDTVLDLCASPGGKSLHAADLAEEGRVISCDVSSAKIARIEENIKRCRFTNIKTVISDATVLNEEFINMADVVIADVPCSGLGVMGRKNDIKYNLTEEAIVSLAALQQKILSNAVQYLRSKKTLIFCTCTCSERENLGNYRFLTEECGLSPVDFYDSLPECLKDESARRGYIQLYGKDCLTDGFFISAFRK